VPLLLSAVSTGAAVYNQNQTAKKQDNVLAQQIRNQSATQQKANAKTSEFINGQAKQDDTAQKAQAQQKFQAQLAANAPQATAALKTPGAVSQAYQQAGANAAQGIAGYGSQQGDLLSSIAAPLQQRRDNQKNIDDYGIEIGNLKHQLGNDDFLSSLKLQGIRPNPWIGAAGSLAGGAAGAYGGGNGSSYGELMAKLSKSQNGQPGYAGYGYTGQDGADYLGGLA